MASGVALDVDAVLAALRLHGSGNGSGMRTRGGAWLGAGVVGLGATCWLVVCAVRWEPAALRQRLRMHIAIAQLDAAVTREGPDAREQECTAHGLSATHPPIHAHPLKSEMKEDFEDRYAAATGLEGDQKLVVSVDRASHSAVLAIDARSVPRAVSHVACAAKKVCRSM